MRILCAECSPVSLQGISVLLSKEGFSLAATAVSGSEIKTKLASGPFDLMISELRFPDAELLDMACELKQSYPNCRILVYTFQDNPTYLARASAWKMYDFVLKRMSPTIFLRSVQESASGIPPNESLLAKSNRFLTKAELGLNRSFGSLTKREMQILTHLSVGLSNREIGNTLGISLETVKEHVQNVLRKVKVSDRTEAAVWALRNGVPTLTIP